MFKQALGPFADALLDVIVVVIPILMASAVALILEFWDVTPAGFWYPLILGIASGYLVYIGLNEVRKNRPSRVTGAINVKAVHREVRDLTDAAGKDGNVDTALLVLDEARRAYERAFSGSESVETKASALLSIVAGASSAVGIFGVGKDGRTVVVSHLTLAAVGSVIVALGLLFYILRAKQLPQPSAVEYVVPAMADRDNRIGISLRLAVTYHDAGPKIARATAHEPAALLAAATLTATAAVLILVNASAPCPPKPSAALTRACPTAAPATSPTPSPGPGRSR
jgi:hypothetical protein